MFDYIKWWGTHWYSRLYKFRWAIAPPILAAMVVPEDGNFLVYLMVYFLGWTSGVCSLYELYLQDRENGSKEDKEES